jgi:hypothetical protein
MNSLEQFKQQVMDLDEDRYQWWAEVRTVVNFRLYKRQVIS